MSKITNEYVLGWAKKIKAINYLGGECSRCGNKNIFVLEFHHLRDKDALSTALRTSRWSVIENELKKCILLCGNCHSELHYVESRGSKLKDDIFMDLSIDPKCSMCGYRGGNLKSLCFHHKNKKNKVFDIGLALTRKIKDCSVQDIIDEIKKCDILCRNCHTEEHIDKNAFLKSKDKIYHKMQNHKEQRRIDYGIIKKMKNEGKSFYRISKILGISKSSVLYAFRKV